MQEEFGRSLDELPNIVSFTDEVFAQNDIDQSVRYIVDLCVEELFVNMVTYDTETDADILVEMSPHDHGIEVSLTDFGVDRFDPRDAAPVDISAPIEQRTPGTVTSPAISDSWGSSRPEKASGRSRRSSFRSFPTSRAST